ncbi:hypothetical protein NLG97_g6845 [Lecanicillium saksenae]|uniref:Uncharacterized protein n=1 Tax=Lecanicillium saksenae TaxID=468837 RepID=A0ACC1QPS6_9HYPO|nr:hypothetical protein NLG97_g6845 [Lecanicillium saksenae]
MTFPDAVLVARLFIGDHIPPCKASISSRTLPLRREHGRVLSIHRQKLHRCLDSLDSPLAQLPHQPRAQRLFAAPFTLPFTHCSHLVPSMISPRDPFTIAPSMDPQHQTGAQAQTQPQTQAVPAQNDANGAPQFDPNFIAQMSNPEAMAGILPGQAFMPDPSMAALPMGDPTMMLPMMFANGQVPPQAEAKSISADEIALYDRQIRLWGMAAQAKIQNANILLITMRALANEVAKNLVLAGVGSLTILDSAIVTEADLGAQFFQSDDGGGGESHVGRNRAEAAAPALRKLNPRVQVHVDAEGVKTKGPSYFAAFDVVIATDLDPDSFNLINTATRINNKAFYAAGTHGLFGFIFSDLIEHDYVIARDAGNVATRAPQQETRTRSIVSVQTKKEGGKTIESVTKRELYSTWFLASDIATLPAEYTSSKRRLRTVTPALSCLRALWEFLQVHPGGGLPATRDDLKLFTQLATQKHKALSLPSETLRPEFLRAFLQNLGAEMAPVAAILGGQLAQDVINVLGQKQQPIQNTACSARTCCPAAPPA